WAINRGCRVESVVALVIGDSITRKRADQAIDIAVIIPWLVQRRLHVGDALIRRQIVLAVNRAVVGIIGTPVVAPSREPVAAIPIIRSPKHENDARVIVPPPISIMPLRSIISKNLII